VVHASLLAMERPESDGQVINVGCGSPISIRRVAQILAAALGKEIEPVITQSFRAGAMRHCYADLTKARRLLGYQPRISHEQGLCELAEWLLQRQAEPQASGDCAAEMQPMRVRGATPDGTNGSLAHTQVTTAWLSEDYAQF
jgi:dTDP-L-rhamnose 4-epimerase